MGHEPVRWGPRLGGGTSLDTWWPDAVGFVPHPTSASYDEECLLGTTDGDGYQKLPDPEGNPAGLDLANLDRPSNPSFHRIGAKRPAEFDVKYRKIIMATWIATAVPLIPEVIRLATPFFSRKPVEKLPDLAALVSELQDAARNNADAITKNAEALETFAANTQKSVEALQSTVLELRRELRISRTLAVVSVTAAALAFCLSAFALAGA